MTIDITDQSRRVQYAGSGTGPYDFAFEVLEQTDIEVYKDTTLLALTTTFVLASSASMTDSCQGIAFSSMWAALRAKKRTSPSPR